MTMKQPEVLRLASALVNRSHPTLAELCAAAELRRLHSINAELLAALQGVLKIERGTSGRIIMEGWQEDVIRAAITKATGENTCSTE